MFLLFVGGFVALLLERLIQLLFYLFDTRKKKIWPWKQPQKKRLSRRFSGDKKDIVVMQKDYDLGKGLLSVKKGLLCVKKFKQK